MERDPYYETTVEWGWDSAWTPCAYCENPAACRDNFETCWRETHTEMSE
jgi:hypothetical protein